MMITEETKNQEKLKEGENQASTIEHTDGGLKVVQATFNKDNQKNDEHRILLNTTEGSEAMKEHEVVAIELIPEERKKSTWKKWARIGNGMKVDNNRKIGKKRIV